MNWLGMICFSINWNDAVNQLRIIPTRRVKPFPFFLSFILSLFLWFLLAILIG